MADWSLLDREWLPGLPPAPAPYDPYQYSDYDPYYQHKGQNPQRPPPAQMQPPQPYFTPPSPTLTLLLASPQHLSPPMTMPLPVSYMPPPPPPPPLPRGDNPREIRNKAEKQRRDKLNHSIAELASMVPPVVAASRKIDKTGVLRLTAHYLRAHQYVFGDSVKHPAEFTLSSTNALLNLLNGFLLTLTYKGLVVVVSQNVNEYLGYTELDLLGHNIFNLTHEDDHRVLRDQLLPRTQKFGTNGELLLPEESEGRLKVAQALANEKRRFIIRFKKLGQRSEPAKYVTCHVEGSLRKSDRACRTNTRCCQIVRRARARGENPCSSGNDVVFIGVVRPTTETFMNEIALETYKMEYRTRHSIDGGIIQCEQRIALVTGYMTHEVNGVNAMNFIHRDEVRWVIDSLREMYDQNRLYGESCYRLMTKNGQFVYMRTRGRLDVDSSTGAVASFVCTNTVVDEAEGKYMIQIMKDKFAMKEEPDDMLTIEDKGASDPSVPVEDPRQLEKVILHLVDNLPAHDTPPSPTEAPTSPRLALIPPRKDRILSAIEKIYTVIQTIPKLPSFLRSTPTSPLPVDDFLRPDKLPPLPYDNTYLQGDIIYNPSPPVEVEPTYPISQVVNQFQMIPPQDFQEQLFPVPGPSGTNRSNYFEEDQMTAKKKAIVPGLLNPEPVNSPSLESFFDEAILNTEIESAIDSLEHTIDPNFPDLLISNEVQEILGNIEGTDDVM